MASMDDLVEIQVKTVIELSPAVTFAEALRVAIFQQPGAEKYPEAAQELYTTLISHPDLVDLLKRFPGEVSVDQLIAKVDEIVSQLLGANVADQLEEIDLEEIDLPETGKTKEFLFAVYDVIAPLWPEEEREALQDRLFFNPSICISESTYYNTQFTSLDENYLPYYDEDVEVAAWQAFTNSVIATVLDPQNSLIPPLAALTSNFDVAQFDVAMDVVAQLASWRPVTEHEKMEELRQALKHLVENPLQIDGKTVPVPLIKLFEAFLKKMDERQQRLLDLWIAFWGTETQENSEKDLWDTIQDRIARGLTPLGFLLQSITDSSLYLSEEVIGPIVGGDVEDFLATFPREAAIVIMNWGYSIGQLGTNLETAFRTDLVGTLAGIALGMGVEIVFLPFDLLALASMFGEAATVMLSPVVGADPLNIPLDELVQKARNTVRDRSASFISSIGGDPTAFAVGFEGGYFAMGVAETILAVTATKGGGIDANLGTVPVGIKNINVARFFPGEVASLSFAPAIELSYVAVTPRSILAAGAYAAMTTGTPPDDSIDAEKDNRRVNSVGMEYPNIIDLKTSEPIPFPEGELTRVPEDLRAVWGRDSKTKYYIPEWYNRGFGDPPLPWEKYQIHHIKPREFGGTNDFENLTPVLVDDHKQFNRFWADFDPE